MRFFVVIGLLLLVNRTLAQCPDNAYMDSNSSECKCNNGYSKNDTVCVDINECVVDNCNNFGTCVNLNGSYRCDCDYGFTATVDGFTCNDQNECLDASTCHSNAECYNSVGSYSCSCKTGYMGNGTFCMNKNECESNPCHNNATCYDTDGSYTCTCNSRYMGNGTSCINENECESNPCHNNATCYDTEGSYTCTCNSGYIGNGTFCSNNSRVKASLLYTWVIVAIITAVIETM